MRARELAYFGDATYSNISRWLSGSLWLFVDTNPFDGRGRALLQIKYGTDQGLVKALKADEHVLEAWETKKTLHVDPDLSKRVSARVAELNGINPTIYDALTTVMYYAALFRHYKAADPAGYASFVSSLQRVSINPSVQTPTVQREAGN